jgi:hypothetical protein
MRALLIACASFAVTVSAGCSGEHTGMPATPPFDPIGTEPTASGDGGAVGNGVFGLFCAQSCASLEAACGNIFGGGDYCAQNCRASFAYYRGCEAQQLTYLACLATTKIDCTFGFPQTPQCDPALQAVGTCQSNHPPGPL